MNIAILWRLSRETGHTENNSVKAQHNSTGTMVCIICLLTGVIIVEISSIITVSVSASINKQKNQPNKQTNKQTNKQNKTKKSTSINKQTNTNKAKQTK